MTPREVGRARVMAAIDEHARELTAAIESLEGRSVFNPNGQSLEAAQRAIDLCEELAAALPTKLVAAVPDDLVDAEAMRAKVRDVGRRLANQAISEMRAYVSMMIGRN